MKEFEVYGLLQKYGIKVPKYAVFEIDQMLSFDKFPAVLKIASDKVIHKSDVGGIRTGIHSMEELQEAKREIVNNLQSHGIFLDLNDRFIVEEELHGEEFYIGGIYDPIFEEVLLFGKGGVMLEVLKDICYIDVYANVQEIIRSFKTTKVSKMFPNFRGKEYKIEYLVDVIQKFQRLFLAENISEFDINPLIYTERGFVAVDARIKKGDKNPHQKRERSNDLFENENIAIFGATDKPQKVGYALAKNALKSSANIFFVNPRLESLFDQKVYHSVDELPNIDTAVIAIPSKYVLDLLEQLGKKGVKNAVVISAGFKESGNIEAEKQMRQIAKKYGMNIVGPNCLGIYNASKRLNLTFAKTDILPGDIALVSQSGAVLAALIDKATSHSIGFSHIISLGNMADFDFADAIEELNTKEECRFINIYAEGLKDGKNYLQAIRASKKPIFVYKAGKTKEAKKAAFSHTGNISGSYEILVGLSYAAGAVIKKDIDELIFASRFEQFTEVLIITNAGGPGTILTDIVVQQGKKMYELSDEEIKKLDMVLPPTWSHNNPVDIIGDATAKRYKAVLDILYKPDILIFILATPQLMTDGLAIAKAIGKKANIVPVFFGEDSFQEAFEYFKHEKILYFNDLENVANIL
ncbi:MULTISPECIES: acetate--CoA ligase family protein [unclassified Nitratiruptor]|uniref:acetate--CoA ligase family protein n=1 Tax=unclassified Nitratiruptor TaxID=2624044 RepID=UPI00191531A2|nr:MULTISPECIES: acetate--CoA ligase family protein [unclassified Nitratiruptor]BCD60359.1 hypothetical protein NitYY0810_C1124 [Nitratiruptor sp. YY08-10]BCD64152.1 hypothetical protein NitYY0814_C0997 [Nitratiruptor sp. YY08-14]